MATLRSVAASTQRLADVGINISTIFEDLTRIDDRQLQLENGSITTLGHEAERFELWAVNLGLYHFGHSSLDYRLRDVEFLQEVFKSLLADLQTSLRQISDKSTFSNDSTAMVTGETAGSVLTKFEQQELADDYGSDSDQDQEDNYALLLRDISDIIDRLYKISTKIRTSSSRLRSSKALQYREVDEDTNVDLFEEFQRIDAHHLRELFRYYQSSLTVETESFLQSRLSAANTRRRQQFGYWRQHHQKMTHVYSRKKQTVSPVRVSTIPLQMQVRNTLEQRDPTNVAQTVVVPSVTTATHLTATRVRLDDQDSVISISTYAGSEQGMDVTQEFPEPPKSFYGLRYFQCPYCYTLCSSTHLEKRAWRSHLIHDLRPYICTYECCELAHVTYDRRQDWVEHESSMHRKSWRCWKHLDQNFANISAYEHHLREYHTDEAKEQLEELIKAGETIASCPERPCPFCFATFGSNDTMERHVAKHLERVALFALPRSTGLEEDKNDISNSSGRIDGTRVSYSSLSAFSNESNTDVEMHESSYLSTKAQPVSSDALQNYPEAGELGFQSRVHEFVTNLQQSPIQLQEEDGVAAAYFGLANVPKWYGLDLSLAPWWAREDFNGTQSDLEKLAQLLNKGPVHPATRPRQRVVAIVGKGRTGKSGLAYTFAVRQRELYLSIMWLNAGSENILRRDMLTMVKSITQGSSHDIVDTSGQDQEDLTVQELLKWLSKPRNGRGLLIFDGYDSNREAPNGFDIQRYFPIGADVSILITSRRAPGFDYTKIMRLGENGESESSPRRMSSQNESYYTELKPARDDQVEEKAEPNRTTVFSKIMTPEVGAKITTPVSITTSLPEVEERPEFPSDSDSHSEYDDALFSIMNEESDDVRLRAYLAEPAHDGAPFVAGQFPHRHRQRTQRLLDSVERASALGNFAMMTRDEEVVRKQSTASAAPDTSQFARLTDEDTSAQPDFIMMTRDEEVRRKQSTAQNKSEYDEASDEDASNERYCYCNDISYGEMVACDNKNCAKEWFHLRCVGLEKAPGENAKWFCDECEELLGMKRDSARTIRAPPFDPRTQQNPNFYGRHQKQRGLPTPDELTVRIEEAKTTARLLLQTIQSTPNAELLSNDLVKEFAERAQSAQRSIQGYMNSDNPYPDEDTMMTLIETSDQLDIAMSKHEHVILQARKTLH